MNLYGDLTKVQDRYLTEEIHPGFKTKVEDLIHKLPGKAKSEQIRAMFKNAGVSAEEMRWLGLDELLKKPVFSKEEFVAHLKSVSPFYTKTLGHNADGEEDHEDLDQSKYHQYALKGGKKYRETVFHMHPAKRSIGDVKWKKMAEPTASNSTEEWEAHDGELEVWAEESGQNDIWVKGRMKGEWPDGHYRKQIFAAKAESPDEVPALIAKAKDTVATAAMKALADSNDDNVDFKSNHWDNTNQLFHIRHQEFTDGDGKQLFLIEEIQSDWHQQGRKKGYRDSRDIDPAQLNVKTTGNGMGWEIEHEGKKEFISKHDAENEQAARERAAMLMKRETNKVPDAPMKKTWEEMAFKYALQQAVKSGAERIGWITGDIAASRFDISKDVGSVVYDERYKSLRAYKPAREKGGVNGGQAFEKHGVTPDQLGDYIGKELADRLMQAPADNMGKRRLEGLDMKVGGEGMKAAYDQRIPSIARKIAKAAGSQVGMVEIPSAKAGKTDEDITSGMKRAARRIDQEFSFGSGMVYAYDRRIGRGWDAHYDAPKDEDELEDYRDAENDWRETLGSLRKAMGSGDATKLSEAADVIKKLQTIELSQMGKNDVTSYLCVEVFGDMDYEAYQRAGGPTVTPDQFIDYLKIAHETHEAAEVVEVHYMDITPEVKAMVEKGLRLTFESVKPAADWWKII